MAQHSTTAYAPVSADNGKLYTHECKGGNKDRYYIFDSAEAAEQNKVFPTDLVKEVKMSWEV